MGLIRRVLPDAQRRTLSDLTEDLDLTAGDARSKRSAFWTMLTLSAVIACAGVLADSTATVIGAMIIAPLSTPIMGIALGIAQRESRVSARSGLFVLGGVLLVVVIGVVIALAVPSTFNLLGNSQISGRTSPALSDLLAAVATGFAGAVAFARRDVASVLPGVAIAISLVPPLAVVGVCLGQGAVALALGALLLFLSNLIALVLAGTLVFTTLGDPALQSTAGRSHRRAYLGITILLIVVGIPLAANTVAAYIISLLTARAQATADQWIAGTPGASIQSVDLASNQLFIGVLSPDDLPSTDSLLAALDDQLPAGITVVVNGSLGSRIVAGQTQ